MRFYHIINGLRLRPFRQFLFQIYVFITAASSPTAWPSTRRLDVETLGIYVSTFYYSGSKLELLESTAWQAPPSLSSVRESHKGYADPPLIIGAI
ncbi:hypothetical protein VNO77_03258 [Canavalia gladiata]|uniref:Uncharacterized protein n=1 Tax=Canavalia gladiata TaxID=3824 RepID=A0AAN9MWF2_CANGL